jgi:dTDP-glucose 4,6-dehydratase
LVSIRALVETILRRLDRLFEDCVEIGAERPGKDSAYKLDSFKLRTELGWRDKISLDQGIDDTISWLKRYANALENLPVKYEHKA